MSNTRRRPRVKKIGFENVTQGYLGAIRINRRNEDEPVVVAPAERIFLTPEEVDLTAQAHARAEDSPFVEREIVHFDQPTGDEVKRFRSAPLRRIEPEPAPA